MSRRRLRWILLGAALAVVVVSCGPGAAARAASWLAAGEAPIVSDLLVVVSGGAEERLMTAVDLYRKGYAPAILVTDPKGDPDRAMRRLVAEGIPPSALVEPPRPATSTVEDARCIREVTLGKKLKSLLVVTSPYHCRRLRLILGRTLGDLDVRVTVTASRSLYWSLDRWWCDRQGWDVIPAEFLKLTWAWLTVPTVPRVGGTAGRNGRNSLT